MSVPADDLPADAAFQHDIPDEVVLDWDILPGGWYRLLINGAPNTGMPIRIKVQRLTATQSSVTVYDGSKALRTRQVRGDSVWYAVETEQRRCARDARVALASHSALR